MTRNEAVNWLINVTADIGKIEHRDLWHYEQALSEIKEMLEESADVRCKDCKHYAGEGGRKKMNDLISRQEAIDAIRELESGEDFNFNNGLICAMNNVAELPSADAPQWIPCSERLPEDIRPVIVTWKNTDPESYYQYIVGKHFTGTACYKNGKWYWYSSTTEDMLAEYGRYDSEEFDEAIECIAWMPLPEPYKENSNG